MIDSRIIIVVLIALICVGCMSGNRKLIGTDVKGADIDTARDSTGTIIGVEGVQGNIKAIEDDADAIGKKTDDEAVAILAGNIEKNAKESSRALKKIHAALVRILKRSLGKKVWSWGRILLLWIVGLVLLGIAVRFVPFFQPVHRAISGIANAAMDVVGGTYTELRQVQLEHLGKTDTIATESMTPHVQKKIEGAEHAAKLKKIDAKTMWSRKNGDA